MKRIVLILAILSLSFLLCAQDFQPPASGKAAIYFIRISSLGSLVDFSYFDGNNYIGKFHGTKFMRYECDPGEHVIWSKAENRDFVEANLEAGKIYLLEPIPQMGAMMAGVSLQRINMDDPKKKEKAMKILAKEPVTFTENQLAEKAAGMQDIIAKGLEKYNEETAAGKRMLRIEKDMNYQVPK